MARGFNPFQLFLRPTIAITHIRVVAMTDLGLLNCEKSQTGLITSPTLPQTQPPNNPAPLASQLVAPSLRKPHF